jgi:AraC-like DNA-binding protein
MPARSSARRTYAVGPRTKQAIAKLMLLLEQQLDDDWTVEAMADRVGYAKHHFARAFAELVGTAPLEYLRVLRLHRAAHWLATTNDVDVTKAADASGYASMKAFRRAFLREFGRTPSEFRREHARTKAALGRTSLVDPPDGLTRKPVIELVGPLAGVSLRSPGLSVAEMTDTLMRREFRCVFVTDIARPPEPPLEPCSMGVHRFARFDYEGATTAIAAAYPWVFHAWLPRSRWHYAFAPVVTLYDDAVWHASGFQDARARIFIPIERH